MAQEEYVYRVFPAEAASNTLDFEVRRVDHDGRSMRGVFARRTIMPTECSLFVGTYPGYRISQEESARKVARYALRNGLDQQAASLKVSAYLFSLKRCDPGFLLDPTDGQGDLLPEFIPYIAGYVNEPPPGFPTKAAYVYNQPRHRYEVWLLQGVEQDEEIFVFYGNRYFRDYPINPDGRDDRFAHFIPGESILRLDQRGNPPVLTLPEIIASEVQVGSGTV